MAKKGEFQLAVEATSVVGHAFHAGIQALEEQHKQMLEDKHLATGSLALDETLKKTKPHGDAHRWDYAIGLSAANNKERVLWLEPHRAGSGEAQTVIDKLEWLKGWLRDSAPELDKLHKAFVWLGTNKENPNDRRRRNDFAQKHGLRRVSGRLRLSEV